jgi:predicted nucleic acid-binding protein
MKIAVTDACIFIDLFDIQLIHEFFRLNLDIHTTIDVFNELNDVQKQLLKAYELGGKLTLHSISEMDRNEIQVLKVSKALSSADKTALFLAIKFDAMLLSSDQALRKTALQHLLECHGILWVFDRWVENEILSGLNAIEKLQDLLQKNFTLRSEKMMVEINKRFGNWK